MIWLLGGYFWLFVHRPFEYYPALGDLYLERAYFILMLLVWTVAPGKGFSFNRLHGGLAAFTAALTFCWLNSPFQEQCYDLVENQCKVVLFYVLLVTSVRDEAGLRRLLMMFIGAVALYMAHSMLEYVNGRYEFRMGIRRMIGVDVSFRDPNSFASTLLLALVMTLPLWRLAKTSTARLPLLAFTGAACLCILLTGSRTGFMGLGVVGGFSLLVSRANKLVFVALVVAALVIAASLPSYLQERFLTIVDPSHGPANAQESMHGRIVGFLAGLELFDQNPIIGVGPGAFPYATGTGFNPHNLPGQLLSEMGLLGAVTFLAFLGCFYLNWREVGKAYRRHPEWGFDMPFQVTRSVGLSVVLLLLLGLAGHNLYRYIWIWLAAFQAIAVHCVRQRVAAEAAAPMRARVAYVRGPRRVGYYLPAAARRPSA